MKDFVRFFKFFYRLIGHKLFYLLGLMVAAALFEGLGMSLFLPLLEGTEGGSSFTRMISSAFEIFQIEYSFTKLLILMVVFFFLRNGFLILQQGYRVKLYADLLVDIRSGLVRKLFGADYLYFLDKDVGYINNAVTVEYQRVAFAFKTYANVLVSVGFSLMYFLIPLSLKPWITAIVLAFGVPALFVIKKINRITREYSINSSKFSARLQAFLIQTLRHFKYLKATFSHENIVAKVYNASEELGDIMYKQSLLQAVTAYGFEPFAMLIVAGLLYYQVQILGGEILEIAFLLYLLRSAIAKALGVQQNYRKFLMSVGSFDVYERLERELLESDEDLKRKGVAPDFEQPIHFQDVNFHYGNGEVVLRDIDLVIPPKSTVAFVGPSGSGKTTLVTFLTGILRPTQGEIRLGDVRYEVIDQELLRRKIGYVTQEGVIFNDTIRNNITLWEGDVPPARVKSAAAKAHISEFIDQLPQGYETLLGEDGVKISGGQRQRVSIAREVFKDVDLLIFDEATSSLDTHSEREIQKDIDEFKGEKTVVLIAHRLSTVKNSDLIFVLKDGEIVEQGSYDQLYCLNGEFRSMVDEQMVAVNEMT